MALSDLLKDSKEPLVMKNDVIRFYLVHRMQSFGRKTNVSENHMILFDTCIFEPRHRTLYANTFRSLASNDDIGCPV